VGIRLTTAAPGEAGGRDDRLLDDKTQLARKKSVVGLTERRYVAMFALLKGRTMGDALGVVCRHLGQETAHDRETIRTAYYDFKKSRRAVSMDIRRGCFYSWAQWVLTVGPAALKKVSAGYIRIGKQNKAIWFSDFTQRLREAATITQCSRIPERAFSSVILPSQSS
jgi:hypothetical protein